MRSEDEVMDAAMRRAQALAERDADALRALHHPAFRWTSHRGDVLDRERYVVANTGGPLTWHGQRLEDAEIAAAGETAVLVAVAVDDVERDGERRTMRVRMTQTWVLADDAWVMLAGHAGAVI
jgi:hypothetical protein